VWVAGLTFLGLLLRRYHLGYESLWFDEADIVQRARLPLPELLQGFTEAGENGPLYTLMLHFWLRGIEALPPLERVLHIIFGPNDEALIRALSAVFGAAAIPVMYALARRVGGQLLGLISATLLTINPFHIWYSQDAKMYTLLVLMTLVSSLLYVEALERSTVGLWAGYVLATWVMLTVHSMSALVLLAQIVTTPFLVAGRRRLRAASVFRGSRSRVVRWGWAMLLILAPLFPIAWLRAAALFAGTDVGGGWYTPTGLLDILTTIFVNFAANRADPVWEVLGGVAMSVLALAGLVSLFRFTEADGEQANLDNSKSKILIVALWLVPIVVFWLVTLRLPLFQPRYLIMSLPPYLILASAGLLSLRRFHSAVGTAATAALLLPTLAALVGVNYSAQVQKEDWRGAIAYVQDHLRLRDEIVVFPGYMVTAVHYYYRP
jgi:uncharacterized membrane protein